MLYIKTILFLIIAVSTTIAQNAWGEEVFLDVKEKSLRFVLNEIIRQTKLNLIFDDKSTENQKVSYDINTTAEKAISKILSENGYTFKKYNNSSAVIYKDKNSSPKTKAVVRKSKIINEEKYTPVETSRPVLISQQKLEYPMGAMRDRLEGEVLTRLLVSSDGDVKEVVLERSSGYEILDTATINYVKKLKFLAAEHNGKYLDAWTSMRVKYNFE